MSVSTQKVTYIIGPDGRRLTLADLPTPETNRWVIRRKAEIVAAVRGGLLSLEQVCKRYKLDTKEFLSWQYCIERYGFPGLRATCVQFYITRPEKIRRLRRRTLVRTAGTPIKT